MDSSQNPLDSFNAQACVFVWGAPVEVLDMLRDTLRRFLARLNALAHPDVIESMMYGCRVAEVTTILLSSNSMDEACVALARERGCMEDRFAAFLEAESQRALNEQSAPPQPGPPRQPTRAPPPTVPWRSPEQQEPAPSRRVLFTPGPSAGRASSAAPAEAGDPLPPQAGASRRGTPPFPAKFLHGEPPNPVMDNWNAAEDTRPAMLRLCPAEGEGEDDRFFPYRDCRTHVQRQGGATRAPGPPQRAREAARQGGRGQPSHGWPRDLRAQGPRAQGHRQGPPVHQDPTRNVDQYLQQ